MPVPRWLREAGSMIHVGSLFSVLCNSNGDPGVAGRDPGYGVMGCKCVMGCTEVECMSGVDAVRSSLG